MHDIDSEDPYGSMSAEVRVDPYGAYARIRSAERVYYSSGWSAWLVTRCRDVAAAFRQPGLSANCAGGYVQKLTRRCASA